MAVDNICKRLYVKAISVWHVHESIESIWAISVPYPLDFHQNRRTVGRSVPIFVSFGTCAAKRKRNEIRLSYIPKSYIVWLMHFRLAMLALRLKYAAKSVSAFHQDFGQR